MFPSCLLDEVVVEKILETLQTIHTGHPVTLKATRQDITQYTMNSQYEQERKDTNTTVFL